MSAQKTVALSLVVGIIVGAIVGYGGAALTLPSTTQLQSEIDSLRSSLSATESERDSARNQLAATQEQLAAAQEELTAAQEQLAATQESLSATQEELAMTQGELTAAQEELAALKQQLAEEEAQAQNAINIAQSDSDVQDLLSDGYNITGRPIITTEVDAEGNVTARAIVMLQKDATNWASVSVDFQEGKVTEIVILTGTVIEKTPTAQE